jgi:hypothetical protein
MAEEESKKTSSVGSMLQGIQASVAPLDKTLQAIEENTKAILDNSKGGADSAEKKFEDKKQEGMFGKMFASMTSVFSGLGKKSDKESKGFFGWLKDNWGKVLIGVMALGVLFMPLKNLIPMLKSIWETMKSMVNSILNVLIGAVPDQSAIDKAQKAVDEATQGLFESDEAFTARVAKMQANVDLMSDSMAKGERVGGMFGKGGPFDGMEIQAGIVAAGLTAVAATVLAFKLAVKAILAPFKIFGKLLGIGNAEAKAAKAAKAALAAEKTAAKKLAEKAAKETAKAAEKATAQAAKEAAKKTGQSTLSKMGGVAKNIAKSPVAKVVGKSLAKIATPLIVAAEAYGAYSDVKELKKKEASGEITKDEATVGKAKAVGKGTGAIAGALGGAATGAAWGLMVGPLGAIVGGVVGGVVGSVLGGMGGEQIGEGIGKQLTKESAVGKALEKTGPGAKTSGGGGKVAPKGAVHVPGSSANARKKLDKAKAKRAKRTKRTKKAWSNRGANEHSKVLVSDADMGGVDWNQLGGRDTIEGVILSTWNEAGIKQKPTFTSGFRDKDHALSKKRPGSQHIQKTAFDLRSKDLGSQAPGIFSRLMEVFGPMGIWGQDEKGSVNEDKRTGEHFHFQLASKGFGGVVDKATGFIAGEDGPERVDIVPLNDPSARMAGMNKAHDERMASQGGTPSINVVTSSQVNNSSDQSAVVLPGNVRPVKIQT